jgi:hypothetical protein
MTFSFSENFGNPFSIDKEAAVCFSQTSLHRPDEAKTMQFHIIPSRPASVAPRSIIGTAA